MTFAQPRDDEPVIGPAVVEGIRASGHLLDLARPVGLGKHRASRLAWRSGRHSRSTDGGDGEALIRTESRGTSEGHTHATRCSPGTAHSRLHEQQQPRGEQHDA